MGVRGRRVWESKSELLAGGADVVALSYQRASSDKKHEGKSVEDQESLNLGKIERFGWTLGGSFTDNDKSASRHARDSEREHFEELIARIAGGQGDVLVMWELARSQRDLVVYVQIRELCYKVGLFFWMIDGELFDLRNKNDRLNLGNQAVQGEYQADAIKDNVIRGIEGAAARGKPHGKSAYGYRRVYDQRTRAFVAEEIDSEVLAATDADGEVFSYTRADVVREIMTEIAAATPISTLVASLNFRGIPSPRGGVWERTTVRDIAVNSYYIGKRNFRGDVIDAQWDALVDEDVFWACQRVLRDPARTERRPARASYLLSYLMRCGGCTARIQGGDKTRRKTGAFQYFCQRHGCVVIRMHVLDAYVEAHIVAWLSREEVSEKLAQAGATDDHGIAAARVEANEIRTELAQWEAAARQRRVKADEYLRITESLHAQLADLEKREKEAAIHPLLRGLLGPQAPQRWADLTIPAKRDVIKMITDIRVMPVPYDPDHTKIDSPVPLSERVIFGGLVDAIK
jgi:site-specific DNA recombinase